MVRRALEGVKVLELCQFVAGPYCTKLLADLGAEVIKVEEPGTGDPARRRGPFLGDIPHAERSGLFLYLNTNKLGITLNLNTVTGKEILRRLVPEVDILVEDNPPQRIRELGLDYDRLREINPQLIMTSVTPFGQTGPYRDYKAYPLNTFHAGGEPCINLFVSVTPHRAPVTLSLFMGEHDGGLSAATATLAALFYRGMSGQGQHVDVSKQESLISLSRLESVLYANRENPETQEMVKAAAQGAGMIGGLMRCQDGYVVLAAMQDNQWRGLVELMGHPAWTKDEMCRSEETRSLNAQKITSLVQEWMVDRTQEEVFRGGQEKGVPIGAVNSPQDLVNSPQLRARGFFVEIEHPEVGRIEYPTAAYRFSKTPWSAQRPAPLLGEHNERIYCGLLGYSRQELVKMRQAGVI